jgi:hypothetical protein
MKSVVSICTKETSEADLVCIKTYGQMGKNVILDPNCLEELKKLEVHLLNKSRKHYHYTILFAETLN